MMDASSKPVEWKIALIGANGMLARMVKGRAPQGAALFDFDLPDFDITDKNQVAKVLTDLQPNVIINCAAFTAVDACEEQEELATRVNAGGVANLAAVARELDVTLVHISTDYVFPGTSNSPYDEEDQVGPLSAYGRSKLKGEQALLASGLDKYYIVRTGWLYGPGGSNFVETVLRLAAEKKELRIVADQIGSPTFTGDLADAIFQLLEVGAEPGIYHFSNSGECSWFGFAKEIVAMAGQDNIHLLCEKVHPIETSEYPLPAPRPVYSVFNKSKYLKASGKDLPTWQTSLREYFKIRDL